MFYMLQTMPKKKRTKNLGGRPVTVGATARHMILLQPWLLKATRVAAATAGVSLAEWWRRAAVAALPQKGGK